MPTSDDYKRGYSKGYSACGNRRWPEFRPITPPDPIIGQLVEAVQKFRDAVDGELAKFSEDDELQTTIGEPMDRVTEALIRLDRWIKTGVDADSPTPQ